MEMLLYCKLFQNVGLCIIWLLQADSLIDSVKKTQKNQFESVCQRCYSLYHDSKVIIFVTSI